VLAHGCPLDLHPRVFGLGHYAQTLVAKATVGLLQVGAEPDYRILVRSSYADYLSRWIVDAMSEYL
jgi:sarcosine oxidase, subunit gamma